MLKIFKIIFLWIVIFSNTTLAQDSSIQKTHRLNFQTQFFQIKEAANYGLVFNGLNLAFGYDFVKKGNHRLMSYSAELAFGVDFRHGIGLNWHFKPVDLFYGYEITVDSKKELYLGPYLATNYQWQLYPELQSGHMFWFTFIDIGPKVIYDTTIGEKKFRITFSNSIAGLASRPIPATETTFYTLKFSDFLSNAHRNLKFGSFDLLNHSHLEIEWLNLNKKELSLGYAFEYFGYYNNPKLNYLTHSFILHWKIGKNKMN